MTRKVRPDEKPKFGQVWSWTESGPKLIAITVDRGQMVGVYLEGHGQMIETGYVWSFANGRAMPEWVLHD